MTPVQEDNNEPKASKASWESLQQGALDHYEELATKAHHWSSFIPAAIKAYKDPDTITPNGSAYLQWLDREIEKCEYGKLHYDWSSHNTSLQCFKEAREKFLSLYPSQTIDSQDKDQLPGFVEGLD